jgi:hypothetical protein
MRCLPSPGSWGVPILKPPTLVYMVRAPAAVRVAAAHTDFDVSIILSLLQMTQCGGPQCGVLRVK